MNEEQLYSIALRKCKWVGDINFLKLVRTAGSAKEAWHLSKSEKQKIEGIGRKIASDLGNEEHLKFAENEIKFCEKNKIKIILRHNQDYPELLQECDDAPAILYVKGNLHFPSKKISIVGTRNITTYGKEFIKEFFQEITTNDLVSVSGLALGVDAEVHQQSIESKTPTIAVLAHGFQTMYPSKNKKLSEKILEENGALITEFNSAQKPDRENFIQRNRVIAGISKATIVVETAFGGGSISTVTFANNYNRDVYALPGKITDKYSQGCNLVISQNKAHTISTIKNLIDLLEIHSEKKGMEELFPYSEVKKELRPELLQIYDVIKKSPQISLDEIAIKSNLSTYYLLPFLLELELSRHIKSLSGRQYFAV